MGLAVGVEYAQKCLYNFFHHQTQSIILQASPFQTNSELCWELVCCHQCLFQVVYEHLFHVSSESVIWVLLGYVSQIASTRSTVDKRTDRRQFIL